MEEKNDHSQERMQRKKQTKMKIEPQKSNKKVARVGFEPTNPKD
jgi:hypothetical protein